VVGKPGNVEDTNEMVSRLRKKDVIIEPSAKLIVKC
jgi:hypothetical protein